jgi:hypothetical protein
MHLITFSKPGVTLSHYLRTNVQLVCYFEASLLEKLEKPTEHNYRDRDFVTGEAGTRYIFQPVFCMVSVHA